MTFDLEGNEFNLLSLYEPATEAFQRINPLVNIDTYHVRQKWFSSDYRDICNYEIKPLVEARFNETNLPVLYLDGRSRHYAMLKYLPMYIENVPFIGVLGLFHKFVVNDMGENNIRMLKSFYESRNEPDFDVFDSSSYSTFLS